MCECGSKSCTEIAAGQWTRYTSDVRKIIWTGYVVQIAGYGLAALYFAPHIATAPQELIVGVVAAGIGLAVSPTMLVIQVSVPRSDMAAATSGWVLIRSMGPSMGEKLRCPSLTGRTCGI